MREVESEEPVFVKSEDYEEVDSLRTANCGLSWVSSRTIHIASYMYTRFTFDADIFKVLLSYDNACSLSIIWCHLKPNCLCLVPDRAKEADNPKITPENQVNWIGAPTEGKFRWISLQDKQ